MKQLSLTCLLVFLLSSQFVHSQDQENRAFNSLFPEIQLKDTLVLSFTMNQADFDKYLVDSTYRIPQKLGKRFLPDSLSGLQIPVWKLSSDGFEFYFVVSTVSNWNSGYLMVRKEGTNEFIHVQETFASEPADSGEHFKQSKLYRDYGKLSLLIQTSDQCNQRSFLNCHSYEETTSTMLMRWEVDNHQFVPVKEKVITERSFFGCD